MRLVGPTVVLAVLPYLDHTRHQVETEERRGGQNRKDPLVVMAVAAAEVVGHTIVTDATRLPEPEDQTAIKVEMGVRPVGPVKGPQHVHLVVIRPHSLQCLFLEEEGAEVVLPIALITVVLAVVGMEMAEVALPILEVEEAVVTVLTTLMPHIMMVVPEAPASSSSAAS